MKIQCTDIKWDTDGEAVDLPTELTVDVENVEEIADALSNKTGWCHLGFSIASWERSL